MASLSLSIGRWFGQSETAETMMVRYAQQGESKLLTKLVNTFGDDLYHFLLSQSDAETAKDVCQLTWIRVMERRESFSAQGRFKPWLFTLGRNLLIDEFRKNGRRATESLETYDDIKGSEEQSQDDSGLLNKFDQLFERLPFEQREAFILQQEGFSLKEIADITGQNSETIKSRLRYARQFLKKHLEAFNAEDA